MPLRGVQLLIRSTVEFCAAGTFPRPVEWILPAIAFVSVRTSSVFKTTATVQLLAKSTEYLTGPHFDESGYGTPRVGRWESPTNLADAEPVMREVLDLIQAEALPYLIGSAIWKY